jgi:alpha-L-fucosidase
MISRRVFLAGAAAMATAINARPGRAAAHQEPFITPGNRYLLQRALAGYRFGQFLHFNMGTFTNQEWADPGLDPKTFAPAALDCGQWADAAKAAGMRFALLVAKHHDGFCLWPSRLSTYNVARSSYPHDIVRQYAEAYRASFDTCRMPSSAQDRRMAAVRDMRRLGAARHANGSGGASGSCAGLIQHAGDVSQLAGCMAPA